MLVAEEFRYKKTVVGLKTINFLLPFRKGLFISFVLT